MSFSDSVSIICKAASKVGRAELSRQSGIGLTTLRYLGTTHWNPTVETLEKLEPVAIRILTDQASPLNNSQRETEGAVSRPATAEGDNAASPKKVAA